MEHIPVLLEPVLEMSKATARPVEYILDGTFGRGGHLKALLDLFPNSRAVGVDRDLDAINYAEKNYSELIASGRLVMVHGNFDDFDQIQKRFQKEWGIEGFDLILVDLGVSSPQLDQGDRGFSFYHDGPLDMRMDLRDSPSAKDIINQWDEEDLIQLFRELGEIQRPQRVVKSIIEQRQTREFKSTQDLSHLIEKVEGWRRKGHHPATQYFLALRLKVNRELEQIESAIEPFIRGLRPGGRLLVITFHSLEDRIVKYRFKDLVDQGRIVTKKVIQPSWHDSKKNPRARSAKLRVFEKGGVHESSKGE